MNLQPQPQVVPSRASRTVSRDIPSSRQSAYRKEQLHRLPARTTKTAVILINAYLICWLPINVNLAWGYIDNASWISSHDVFRAVNLLIVFNSVLNPLIYGVSLKEIWGKILSSAAFGVLRNKWRQVEQFFQGLPCCKKPTPIIHSDTDIQHTRVASNHTPTANGATIS